MHHSRLAGFIVDCQVPDLDQAAAFWRTALGMADLGADGTHYRRLDASARDLTIEVQSVEHPSRVHLDIEADDVTAEVRRLEGLGARRVAQVKTWWVMEAPTGQRFCVVEAKRDLAGVPGVTEWP
jgi:hypothetical protein